MKYVLRDQNKDITSPHTNKKYVSCVSPWFYVRFDNAESNKQLVNTYFKILDDQHKFPEGEVLFMQFDRDTVAYNDCYD
jgi:hypothetical protein